MKKCVKYILIAVTIFFVGIVNVKAENVTNITCTYKLPYTGLDINDNQVLNAEPESLYFTAQITITNGDISNLGLNNYKNVSKSMYPSEEFKNYIDQNGKCPDFININVGPLKTAEDIAKGFIITTLDKENDSIHILKVSNSNDFVNNVKKNSGNSNLNKLPSLGTHKFIVPLYSVRKEQNGKTTEEFSSSTMQKYVDTTLDGWYLFLKSNETKIDSCSSAHSGSGSKNCNILEQASLYLNSIGIDGSIRQLADKTKFNYIYNLLDSMGYVSDELKKEVTKEQNLDDKKSLLNEIENNKCLGYCIYDDSTSINYCKTYNTKYKTCRNCYSSKCINKSGTELETCLSGCLGQDEYNALNNLAEQFEKELESQIASTSQSLYKTNVPILEGISFNQPYKLKCSDFSVLHTFWRIITIIAPILTILFGVLDYAMAVIASDEEKMKKSRKKFPKRLIAMIVLIIVPILISIIVDSFGTNEGMKDTSALKCIINGE